MSLFAIADLHLSLGTNKPMDIFKGWDNYVERLEKNWRAVVGEEDTVVIAGDISWAMRIEDSVADFAMIHSLPGKKLILKGNHDYWWTTRKKMEEFFAENGFTSIGIIYNSAESVGEYAVCGTRGWFYDAELSGEDQTVLLREVGRLNLSLDAAEKTGLEPVVFLHYPPLYAQSECGEMMEVLRARGIKRCYYGHIHGGRAAEKAVAGVVDGIEFFLIACDSLNFTPILVG